MKTKTYKLFWVTDYGTEWTTFTWYDVPYDNKKKNISALRRHPMLREYSGKIKIIKQL
jgi:hypothetical protein